jgi:hypothetical protein
MATIGDFLKDLSDDPDLLVAYHENPTAVLAAREISDPDKEILLSDDPAELLNALRREFPGENFFEEQWRPIRFPLPIPRPRPIRRAGS